MYKAKLGLLIAAAVLATSAFAEQVVVSDGGIQVTDQEVRAYIAERIAMGQPSESFAKTQTVASAAENVLIIKKLAERARSSNTTLTALNEVEIELYREKVLYREYVTGLIDKELANTDWSKVAKEEYLANPAQFTSGTEYADVAHILIVSENRTDAQAQELAAAVLKEAREGADFFELAEKYTEESVGKERQGRLGRVTRGQMVPEFEEASFALTTEAPLSGVIKTEFGYHIIKLLDKGVPKQLSFEQVESALITELKKKVPNIVRGQLATEARGSGNAEVNEPVLLQLVNDYQVGNP